MLASRAHLEVSKDRPLSIVESSGYSIFFSLEFDSPTQRYKRF
jgi:hypothetical protein